MFFNSHQNNFARIVLNKRLLKGLWSKLMISLCPKCKSLMYKFMRITYLYIYFKQLTHSCFLTVCYIYVQKVRKVKCFETLSLMLTIIYRLSSKEKAKKWCQILRALTYFNTVFNVFFRQAVFINNGYIILYCIVFNFDILAHANKNICLLFV